MSRDEIEWLLTRDYVYAMRRLEVLRRQLARAERVAEKRNRELANYRVDGTVPKRKRIRKDINEVIIRRYGRLPRGGDA